MSELLVSIMHSFPQNLGKPSNSDVRLHPGGWCIRELSLYGGGGALQTGGGGLGAFQRRVPPPSGPSVGRPSAPPGTPPPPPPTPFPAINRPSALGAPPSLSAASEEKGDGVGFCGGPTLSLCSLHHYHFFSCVQNNFLKDRYAPPVGPPGCRAPDGRSFATAAAATGPASDSGRLEGRGPRAPGPRAQPPEVRAQTPARALRSHVCCRRFDLNLLCQYIKYDGFYGTI